MATTLNETSIGKDLANKSNLYLVKSCIYFNLLFLFWQMYANQMFEIFCQVWSTDFYQ